VHSGELWLNMKATLIATVVAFVLASAVGVVVGVALGVLPRTERVLSPFLDAFNATPRIALAPVFIIYFGITTQAKVALAFTLVVFIVLSASRAGVRSADPDALRLSAVTGANKRQLFMKVLLPVAVPQIFASLRLGLIYSLLGVVASEIIASRSGLGQLVAKYTATYQLDHVYSILILLALIATALNQLMVQLEGWLLRWQPPADK
jgi:NitT/TauT family transport system permease protein